MQKERPRKGEAELTKHQNIRPEDEQKAQQQHEDAADQVGKSFIWRTCR